MEGNMEVGLGLVWWRPAGCWSLGVFSVNVDAQRSCVVKERERAWNILSRLAFEKSRGGD
jgi:hypothetical protein